MTQVLLLHCTLGVQAVVQRLPVMLRTLEVYTHEQPAGLQLANKDLR
ncbi:MAG: hypothetical protein DIU68_017240 [Chloroflexota bacterium]